MGGPQGTILPFLYPCLGTSSFRLVRAARLPAVRNSICRRYASTEVSQHESTSQENPFLSHLNPPPTDYGRTIFADKATLTLFAGSGGHGCISFLREKFIEEGPPNGGDGGSGGSVYIQAVQGETSLHKLARRSLLKAGRGKNGQGKGKGGQRGEDLLVQVPVGTVVRETSRQDPIAEEEENMKLAAAGDEGNEYKATRGTWRRDKWVTYPAATPSEYSTAEFPSLPRTRRLQIASAQPEPPIMLDLSKPMEKPMLLAAGAVGGLGNPHFVTATRRRPKFATKGEAAISLNLELELKILADVGFVGMPNAGKSTLLRALSRSRARVGDWAFTTLQPNIGTMVLDNSQGRPLVQASKADGEPRTKISVADIPGLITDAHMDKGLGLGFLRHVERAQVLAFVVDLGTGDATESLNKLWKELGEFETLKDNETSEQTESRMVNWKPLGRSASSVSPQDKAIAKENESFIIEPSGSTKLSALPMAPISSKPWFVVATKADLENTQENFARLQAYLDLLARGGVNHPSGRKNAWRGTLVAIPVSAIRGEGVGRIPEWTVGLLED
ncbi:GTPase of the mitochondrial inner membrane that associates with the large ribosomal subunit [Puttea exsequens]|nr:GTPase of the mitochondrial inner membrane that associates with the large ribosomal subunit [Puttea exsequens]